MSKKVKVVRILVLTMMLVVLFNARGKVFASRGNIEMSKKEQVAANPTKQKISVDGKEVNFRAYNIEGNNYFMLRDIAHIFKNTKAQFEVGWDQEKFAINLETGKTYSGRGVGFEMKSPHIKEIGNKSRATIYKNNKEAFLLGYTIKGNTYFKLRDLGKEMDFLVDWDSKNQEVVMVSDINKSKTEVEVSRIEVKKENVEVKVEENKKSTSERQKQEMREEMLKLINEARAKKALNPLVLNNKLVEMSKFKAQDMKKLDKLSHDGSYGSFIDLLSLHNINYRSSGENILLGGSSAQDMFNMWWNSPGHRANMMNPEYRQIGIAFEEIKTEKISTSIISDEFKSIAKLNEYKNLNTYSAPGYWGVQQFTD